MAMDAGFIEWVWPAVVTGLSVMSARIVYLQDDKIKKVTESVVRCDAKIDAYIKALTDIRVDLANCPTTGKMDAAIDKQYDRISELMAAHNKSMGDQLAEVKVMLNGILHRELGHRHTDK